MAKGDRIPCTFCGQPSMCVEGEGFRMSISRNSWCSDCLEKDQKRRDDEERQQERERQWLDICPTLYRLTNPDDSRLNQDVLRAVLDWEPKRPADSYEQNPAPLLYGPSGTGKTRIAFLLLKKLHFRGYRCTYVRSTAYAKACLDMFSDDHNVKDDARTFLSRINYSDVILFDDLGKGKLTPHVEGELFELLENRTTRNLVTIWTLNASLPELARMLSKDRRDPIIRRIREFSQTFKL